jgi:hypothetical protein
LGLFTGQEPNGQVVNWAWNWFSEVAPLKVTGWFCMMSMTPEEPFCWQEPLL